MNMPGFTAEAAVYATGRSYRAKARFSGSNAASGVSPSLIGSRGSGRACIPGCICVQPEGCPCCESIGSRQRALNSGTPILTCGPGYEEVCTSICDVVGGGLQTNPNGTTTCTVYQSQ